MSIDFRKRFLSLLSFKFREFGGVMALSVLEAANAGVKSLDAGEAKCTRVITLPNGSTLLTLWPAIGTTELSYLMTPFDLKRLESYAANTLDYHVILDLLPAIAALYFERRLGSDMRLSAVQSSILLALGLQRKTIEEVEVRRHIRDRMKLLSTLCYADGASVARGAGPCSLR